MKNVKKIDNKTLHTPMIEEADKAIQGRGDGRISMEDAKKIAAHLKTADKELGTATLQHIKENYKVTSTGQAHFAELIGSKMEDITIDVVKTIEWTYESWSGKNFDPTTITDYLNKKLSMLHPAYIKIAVDEYLVWKQSGILYNALLQYYNTTERGLDGNLRFCPEPSTQQGGNFKNYSSFKKMTDDLQGYKPKYRQIYSHALLRADYNDRYRTWTMIQVEETFEAGNPSENNKIFLWESKSTNDETKIESTYQDVPDASPFCVKTCMLGQKENEMQFDIFFNKKMPTAQLSEYLALPYYDFKNKWYWGVRKFSSSDEVLSFLNKEIDPQLSYLCQITAGSTGWPAPKYNPTNNYYVFYPLPFLPYYLQFQDHNEYYMNTAGRSFSDTKVSKWKKVTGSIAGNQLWLITESNNNSNYYQVKLACYGSRLLSTGKDDNIYVLTSTSDDDSSLWEKIYNGNGTFKLKSKISGKGYLSYGAPYNTDIYLKMTTDESKAASIKETMAVI